MLPEEELRYVLATGQAGNPTNRNWDGWAQALITYCFLASGEQVPFYVTSLAALQKQDIQTTDYRESPYGSVVWFRNPQDGNCMIHLGEGRLLGVGRADEMWLQGAGVYNEMRENHAQWYAGWSEGLV